MQTENHKLRRNLSVKSFASFERIFLNKISIIRLTDRLTALTRKTTRRRVGKLMKSRISR